MKARIERAFFVSRRSGERSETRASERRRAVAEGDRERPPSLGSDEPGFGAAGRSEMGIDREVG
jgi:hypothetical protein